jgi:hypothetical protein
VIAVGGLGITNFALARLTFSGALDASFGGDGRVTTDFSDQVEEADAENVVELSNGKLLVLGRTYAGPFNNPALARYLP